MAADDGEKSQDPTPHRRREMRERGQVAQSHDLTSAAVLLGGLTVLVFTGAALLEYLAGYLIGNLSGQAWMNTLGADATGASGTVINQWQTLTSGLAKVLLPVLGSILLLAVGVSSLQTGLLFMPSRVLPDMSRVNPVTGLGRIVSGRGTARMAFGLVKVVAIAAVAGASLYARREEIVSLSGMGLPGVAAFAWDVCLWTCVKIGFTLAALAVLDYGFERWKLERDARMTPQEVREEQRTMQGDPQVVARRRAALREMAEQGPSSAVTGADVVIASPEGLIVALRYQAASMAAPIVSAKGSGANALRIRRLAEESGVPIVEKKQLAAALHKQVAVRGAVPEKLFAQVAEVLAYAGELTGRPRSSLRRD
jgi:flagellar biosynthesis protein FlhB